MIVYCDVEDCKHNKDGFCECVWPIGTKAIKIQENYMGIPFCTDFKNKPDEECEK